MKELIPRVKSDAGMNFSPLRLSQLNGMQLSLIHKTAVSRLKKFESLSQALLRILKSIENHGEATESDKSGIDGIRRYQQQMFRDLLLMVVSNAISLREYEDLYRQSGCTEGSLTGFKMFSLAETKLTRLAWLEQLDQFTPYHSGYGIKDRELLLHSVHRELSSLNPVDRTPEAIAEKLSIVRLYDSAGEPYTAKKVQRLLKENWLN